MAVNAISGCPAASLPASQCFRHSAETVVLSSQSGSGGCSPSDVLQAGRASIGRDRLLRQQHEAEGAGGEPLPEVAGEMHVWMLRAPVYGSKMAPSFCCELLALSARHPHRGRGSGMHGIGQFRVSLTCSVNAVKNYRRVLLQS